VIAQLEKVQALFGLEWGSARPQHVSYEGFEESLSAQQVPVRYDALYTGQTSANEGLLKYFWWTVERRRAAGNMIKAAARGNWRLLITDAQHDPYVRELVREAIAAGKEVALVPEGAISYVGALEPFGGSGLFITDPHVTRFVLNEAERASWIARGTSPDRVFVSGFVGNTRGPRCLVAVLSKLMIMRALGKLPSANGRTTVLLSFDVFAAEFAIARFGSPSQVELLDQLLQVLEVLLASGCRVVAKTRDPHVNSELQVRFVGKPVLFTDILSWMLLADRSDVVVVRDSSIGWEALARGKPVVVWNLSDYPSFAEVTLKGISRDWVRTVGEVTDLPGSIAELVKANRAARTSLGPTEVQGSVVEMRPEQIRAWSNEIQRGK
jgi:hypothetical protein